MMIDKGKEQEFTCKTCGKTFKASYGKNMLYNREGHAFFVMCPHCGYEFSALNEPNKKKLFNISFGHKKDEK
jgi:transposase-like protein